jgi:hypothetical protein
MDRALALLEEALTLGRKNCSPGALPSSAQEKISLS